MQPLSRNEYIRLARESCTRNLSYNGGNIKNNGMGKSKGYLKTEKLKAWDYADLKNRQGMAENRFIMSAASLKSLLIRLICALVLFLVIFLIDAFDIKINSFNSRYIQDLVTSNQSMDKAENFFVSLYEEFVKSEK